MGRMIWLLLWSWIACGPAASALVTPVSATAAMVPNKSGNPGAASEANCRKFVQAFYNWYLRATRNHGGFETAIERKPRNFSRELIRGLREDRAAQRKSPGEIVGLEFDPFLNSQDAPNRYDAGKVTRKRDRYLADVYGRYSGAKSARPTVVAELRMEHGRWVFVNFHYPKDAGERKTENLLAILAGLKADRAKGR